ncbi:MAG: amino acid transporter [Alphaproteobacteria bacterium]|nr:MAG: amino acid transporter [Alphaproteobacteria bacterium]
MYFNAFTQGFTLLLTLIVAIGPQNLFVLKHGITKRHVGFTSMVTGLCDSVVLAIGGLGAGYIFASHEWLKTAILWAGIVFLYTYSLRCFYKAWRPGEIRVDLSAPAENEKRWPIFLAAAGFTFLNPQALLDLFVIIGGVAAQYPLPERYIFVLGSIAGSNLWFLCLGYAGKIMSKLFVSRRAWQILDMLIGLTMLALASKLLMMELP